MFEQWAAVSTQTEESAPASARFERLVPFRTGTDIPIGIEDRFVTVDSVAVTSCPKPEDVRKADGKPDETTRLTVKFTYSNRDDDDWKCMYRVQVLDAAGAEIGSGAQERTMKGTEAADTNRVSVKMRTMDFPRAAKLKIRITAHPD